MQSLTFFLQWLMRKEATAPAKEPAWPNELNPCPYGGKHGSRPFTKCSWWCHDRVTEICSGCVWDKEREFAAAGSKEPRYDALKTFKPDPTGAPCTRQ